MVCRVRPDWDVCVVPPTRGGRCGIVTTVQLPFKTPYRSRQFVHSATSIDIKMEKEVFRAGTFTLTIPSTNTVWKKGQDKPLICTVCLPLSCHRPWSLRGTKIVGDMERSLRGVQSFNTAQTGSLLRKFIEQTRALESMPVGVMRHMLRADEVGQVSCEDLGD
jgi:hypothetical protein